MSGEMPQTHWIKSADDLLAVALALEEEAARRYRELADWARDRGSADLADVVRGVGGDGGRARRDGQKPQSGRRRAADRSGSGPLAVAGAVPGRRAALRAADAVSRAVHRRAQRGAGLRLLHLCGGAGGARRTSGPWPKSWRAASLAMLRFCAENAAGPSTPNGRRLRRRLRRWRACAPRALEWELGGRSRGRTARSWRGSSPAMSNATFKWRSMRPTRRCSPKRSASPKPR